MQKAIIVTSYNQNSDEKKYSIEALNGLLQKGWKVITCSQMPTANPTISEFLVIIENSEKSNGFKPE